MHGNLVARVDRAHVLRIDIVMRNANALADQLVLIAEKLGIEVERALEPVFIKEIDQADILGNAIVIAEGDCLFLSVEHKKLLYICF